jgi:4-hydroxy-3-methylbut-2-enyl diphosphate reductase
VCVFSAHGVAPAVHLASADRGLEVIDATCPLVAKVHQEARRFARDGRTILLIGHSDHEEIEGTYGEAPDQTVIVESIEDVARLDLQRGAPVSYLTQTTLSLDDTAEIVDALRERFDDLRGPAGDDICYASQNRQNAVKTIAGRSDVVLVVGSTNSSNSIRMVEVARDADVPAHLVPDIGSLDERWLDGVGTVGVSAGASVPEILVDQVLDRLAALGYDQVDLETIATEEGIVFSVPAGLASDTGRRRTDHPQVPGAGRIRTPGKAGR